MVLSLMTMPIIIIASRAALKAVPPSIREAARRRRVESADRVPPRGAAGDAGMLTGAILGMAHALGETAPLLMIGMVAFIVDIPSGPLDAATVMPVQIFCGRTRRRAFVERLGGDPYFAGFWWR